MKRAYLVVLTVCPNNAKIPYVVYADTTQHAAALAAKEAIKDGFAFINMEIIELYDDIKTVR